MNDQRVEAWTLLHFKNFRDGNRIKRVSRETVNCFGWQRDRFAFLQ